MTAVRQPALLRGLASFVMAAAVLVGISQNSASAQTSFIDTQAPPSTTIPGLVLTMSFEIPLTATAAGLPTGTFVKATITVTNPSSVALVNQPMVLRFGQKPDQILGVDDGTGKVGVIDPNTGAWYHTIATIAANSSTTYTVTYGKLCAGRWAFAARVGDKVTSQFVQWAGSNDARCVGDETTSPQPASFYQLPWPSSIVAPSTTLVTTTSTSTTTTLNPLAPTTSGLPGVAGVGVSSTSTSSTKPGASTSSTSSTRPGASTTTTLLSLDKLPMNTSTTRTTTTKVSSARTTTTVLFCKTVGGKRYCAPKSSAYKPGQKKATEVAPKITKSTIKKKK